MAKLSELLKDAGLADEEIVATMSAFKPEAVTAIEGATLRQADYSRNMDALAKTRKELETSWQTANTEYVRMQTDFNSTKAERDEAARKLSEAEAKLATATQVDTSKFLTDDQLQAKLASYAAGQTAYFGDVLEIVPEHEKLFGTKLNAKTLIQEATAAGKTPNEFWTEKYNVGAKRTEIAEKEKTEYEARIRAEERQKVTAEFLNPATRPLSDSQKPFYAVGPDAKQPWEDTTPTAAETQLVAELANAGR
jgi:hypothetical protein